MGDVMVVVGYGVVFITAIMALVWGGLVMWVIFQTISGKSPLRKKAISAGPAITWRRMSDEEVRQLMPPAPRRSSSGHGLCAQQIAQRQAALDRAQMDSVLLHQIELEQMEHEGAVHESDFGSDFDAGSDFGSGSDW